MIELCLKRPFLRPLALWLLGIVSYLLFPPYWLIALISLLFLSIFFLLFLSRFGRTASLSFDGRWVWGALFAPILFALSVWTCCYADCFRPERKEPGRLERWAEESRIGLAERFDQLALTGEEKGVVCDLALGYGEAMERETSLGHGCFACPGREWFSCRGYLWLFRLAASAIAQSWLGPLGPLPSFGRCFMGLFLGDGLGGVGLAFCLDADHLFDGPFGPSPDGQLQYVGRGGILHVGYRSFYVV